jgi:hypothetical protein
MPDAIPPFAGAPAGRGITPEGIPALSDFTAAWVPLPGFFTGAGSDSGRLLIGDGISADDSVSSHALYWGSTFAPAGFAAFSGRNGTRAFAASSGVW